MARVLGIEPRVFWFWRPVVYQLTETRKMVRKEGVEPSRTCVQQILSLSRLPVPPLPHYFFLLSILYVIKSATTLIKMLPINPTRTPNKKCIINLGWTNGIEPLPLESQSSGLPLHHAQHKSFKSYPYTESDCNPSLRRRVLYPLSYRGINSRDSRSCTYTPLGTSF